MAGLAADWASVVWAARVVSVHDGDTVDFEITVDCGFRDTLVRARTFRLLGINAIELADPGGAQARDNLAALLPPGLAVSLRSVKPDKFAPRWLALITLPDGRDVATVLVEQGWAARWDGRGVKPVPAWPRTF